MLKQALIIIPVMILIVTGTIFFLHFLAHRQPSPDDLFKSQVIGMWRNVSQGSKTWLWLKEDKKCIYHTNGKDNGCFYQIANREITITLKVVEDPTVIFRKIVGNEGKSFDLEPTTSLGMKIDRISIRGDSMSARMKGFSSGRTTVGKPVNLIRVKNPESVINNK